MAIKVSKVVKNTIALDLSLKYFLVDIHNPLDMLDMA